jgi:HEPN domain-containing protein
MLEETKNWLEMVNYDLDTARQMFNTKRYIYVIFMCHLAIEKALKAIVCEETKKFPPKTHDLIFLTRQGKVEFTEDLLNYIGKINNVAIITRYPEDLSKLVSSYTKTVTQEYLDNAIKVIEWIKQDPRLETS